MRDSEKASKAKLDSVARKRRGRAAIATRRSALPVQDRALQTREDLLKAARRVFARDGFESARLEDIARDAGRTRGALYTHFRDKEDLFFALIEQDIARDSEVYSQRLTADSTFEERLEVITDQVKQLVHDRKRVMLYLEFKLYALRHPPSQKKRLVDLHARVCREGAARKLDLVPEFRCQTEAERRRTGANFGAVLDGVALNMYFDPEGLTADDIHHRIETMVREQLALHAMPDKGLTPGRSARASKIKRR